MNIKKSILKSLILNLQRSAELYQPLYKFDVPGRMSGRQCIDRMLAIDEVMREEGFSYERKTVLDIGSSLGYFSLSLADKGMMVDSFDVSRRLYWIQKLLSEYNGLHININKIPITLENMNNLELKGKIKKKYDIILLLSVLHHICHDKGFDYARRYIKSLSKRTDYLIIELAQRTEIEYEWAISQPEDVESFLEGLFTHGYKLIGRNFHISHGNKESDRPIYLCRNRSVD